MLTAILACGNGKTMLKNFEIFFFGCVKKWKFLFFEFMKK